MIARRKRKGGRPTKRTPDALAALVEAREAGLTLRESAAAAGVHVSTVVRWRARFPWLRDDLGDAERTARKARPRQDRRPSVPVRRDCPACGDRVECATAWLFLRFWRCASWPGCPWVSWRPPAPGSCACGGVLYWSHSRKTVGCAWCGRRRPGLTGTCDLRHG